MPAVVAEVAGMTRQAMVLGDLVGRIERLEIRCTRRRQPQRAPACPRAPAAGSAASPSSRRAGPIVAHDLQLGHGGFLPEVPPSGSRLTDGTDPCRLQLACRVLDILVCQPLAPLRHPRGPIARSALSR